MLKLYKIQFKDITVSNVYPTLQLFITNVSPLVDPISVILLDLFKVISISLSVFLLENSDYSSTK